MAEGKDIPGVVMLPPYLFLIALGAMALLEIILPIPFLPGFDLSSVWTWFGLLMCAAGGGIAVWGAWTFYKAGTNIPPDRPALKFVGDGPYAYTRNPMYLGMHLVLIGLTIAVSLDWGIFVWPVFAMVMHYGVIRREEVYLTRKFGSEYTDFLARVPRYVSRLTG